MATVRAKDFLRLRVEELFDYLYGYYGKNADYHVGKALSIPKGQIAALRTFAQITKRPGKPRRYLRADLGVMTALESHCRSLGWRSHLDLKTKLVPWSGLDSAVVPPPARQQDNLSRLDIILRDYRKHLAEMAATSRAAQKSPDSTALST